MGRVAVTVWRGWDQPDVEVLLTDDTWVQGEARMRWREAGDRSWWYQVTWRRGPGQGTYVDAFPAARVRLDTIDRSLRLRGLEEA